MSDREIYVQQPGEDFGFCVKKAPFHNPAIVSSEQLLYF